MKTKGIKGLGIKKYQFHFDSTLSFLNLELTSLYEILIKPFYFRVLFDILKSLFKGKNKSVVKSGETTNKQ